MFLNLLESQVSSHRADTCHNAKTMFMQKFLIFLFCLIIFTCCNDSDKNGQYNLEFCSNNTSWDVVGEIRKLLVLTDSISGKIYLAQKPDPNGISFPIFGEITQTIYLPIAKKNERIKISLKAKSSNVQTTLEIFGYDKNENIICSASSRLRDMEDFCYAEMSIPSDDVRFIRLNIKVVGERDFRKEQALYPEQMIVEIGSKNIEALTIPNFHIEIE